MSLSARIAFDPSWRVAAVEAFFPVVGVVLAAAAVARRSPALLLPLTVAAIAFAVGFAIVVARSMRVMRRRTLTVSDRLDLAVDAPEMTADGELRVAASTLLWPSFAVLALSRGGDDRVVRWPFALGTLAHRDRRALARYLGWVLRGGGERHAPTR
jgi:hypothetical protein